MLWADYNEFMLLGADLGLGQGKQSKNLLFQSVTVCDYKVTSRILNMTFDTFDVVTLIALVILSVLLIVSCHWCQAERRRLLFMNPKERRESLDFT